MTRLALISDLHIGRSRARDFNPSPIGNELTDQYLRDFDKFASALEWSPVADYLLITGDVTDAATKEQVTHAKNLIPELARSLGVEEQKVFWVPGNHDRCWALIDAHGDKDLAYQFFKDDCDNILTAREKESVGEIFDSPYVGTWVSDDLVVVGINSAFEDVSSQKPHHGSVNAAVLSALQDAVARIDPKILRPWIFLLHHHPIDYDDGTGYWKDFSQLQNSATLRSKLADLQFDLVLHGHRHHPNMSYELSDNGHGRTFICSGSFSANLQLDNLRNQFHLIDLRDRDRRSEPLTGTLFSWSYSYPYGWDKSRQQSGGIEHRIGFGRLLDYDAAKRVMVEALAPFEASRVAKWPDIVAQNMELSFFPTRLVRRVLKDIESDGPWQMHDIRDLDELVLFIM